MHQIHHWLSDSRTITPHKIQKALNIGNLDGVRRLAKFVGCASVYPNQIYSACEKERVEFYNNYESVRHKQP